MIKDLSSQPCLAPLGLLDQTGRLEGTGCDVIICLPSSTLTNSGMKPDFQERAGCGRRTDDRKSDDSPSGDRTEQAACDGGSEQSTFTCPDKILTERVYT